MKILLILFTHIFTSQLVFSQEWDAGGWLGASHYFGDLNTTTQFQSPYPAGGIYGRYNFSQHVAVKSSLSMGWLSFKDKLSNNIFQQKRNLSFSSQVVEFSVQTEFNFLSLEIGNEKKRFAPYLFGGMGLFYFNPKADGERLKPLSTEGQDLQEYPDRKRYFLVQPTTLYGMGLKFRFYKSLWSWGVEAGNRHTFTDYLDDVSKTYIDKNALQQERGAMAAALSDRSGELDEVIGEKDKQRGDSKNKDSYFFIGFNLTYTFRNIKCPPPNSN